MNDLALFMGHLRGSEIAYQHGHDEHRAKDDQHCSVWISKIRIQVQSSERDDGEIKHVSRDGKGPAGMESMTRSQCSGAPCHWIHPEGNHNERKEAGDRQVSCCTAHSQ